MHNLLLQASQVFTPNDFPAWTYVERQDNFDRNVLYGLKIPNMIISISGPSKSGKSVLYQRPKHLTLVAIGVPLASAF